MVRDYSLRESIIRDEVIQVSRFYIRQGFIDYIGIWDLFYE